MKHSVSRLLCLALVIMTLPAWGQDSVPSGDRWLDHLNKDLIPFWTSEAALGRPLGAFPSIRCDDGALPPCPGNGLPSPANERYLVALSRQSFGYGVAFHLTGDRKYLDAMRAGIAFIRLNAMDRANGGMATVQDLSKGTWGPAPDLRNPQELAYGLLGMAFYYYLTGDPDVLEDLLSVKNYIFEKYSTAGGALQLQLGFPVDAIGEDKQLVAQLDQMNTYLVLLTPLLPEPVRSEWKETLVRLSKVMINQFYSPTDKLFFRAANKASDKDQTETPTDFGHNAKALWMIRFAGLLTGHKDLVEFAQDNAQTLLEKAYLSGCGCWAGGLRPKGILDLDKPWWVYAELNQLTGTLAINDATYARYLPRAYDYWFNHFVDSQFGEVWTFIDGRTHQPMRQHPKQSKWKNAYHSLEHALVGYIVAQALNNKPVSLYYAFPSHEMAKSAQPYYYSGKAIGVEGQIDDGNRTQKVTFSEVR